MQIVELKFMIFSFKKSIKFKNLLSLQKKKFSCLFIVYFICNLNENGITYSHFIIWTSMLFFFFKFLFLNTYNIVFQKMFRHNSNKTFFQFGTHRRQKSNFLVSTVLSDANISQFENFPKPTTNEPHVQTSFD